MNEEPEIDFDDFLEELYKNAPKDKNSIVLSLDCDNFNILFQRLVSIFHFGTIYFFGDDNDKVDLNKLKQEDFQMLNSYFNSFGIEISYKIIKDDDMNCFKNYVRGDTNSLEYNNLIDSNYSQDIYMYDLITYKNCESPVLNDYRLSMKVNDVFYIIWFNFNS